MGWMHDEHTSSFVQVYFQFTHSEVSYPYVTVMIKQDIVELQVTVVD